MGEKAVSTFESLPAVAAWRHRDARDGFETAFLTQHGGEIHLEGQTVAVESGEAWSVRYTVVVDDGWLARVASIAGRSMRGRYAVRIESAGRGRWLVDGEHRPELDGCLDIDLESSACTNTLPVRRLALAVGDSGTSPAVYVRALDLSVTRLDQDYARRADNRALRYRYRARAFAFEADLTFDRAGLCVDYPGIAERVL
jgi:hypothetical protein